jgi:hypothetical protein
VTLVTRPSTRAHRSPIIEAMSVGGISASSASNPYAALVQQQAATADALFGSPAGTGASDGGLGALTPTAVAYGLYTNPGLLQGLTQWDGSTLSGSQRAAAAQPAAPSVGSGITPQYAFNPFDPASWDVDTTGSTVDTQA